MRGDRWGSGRVRRGLSSGEAWIRGCCFRETPGPHHKVCGEFLSYETLHILKEMGILWTMTAPIIKHFRLSSPRTEAKIHFSFSRPGMSRYKLDEELLNNARSAGADVFRGVCMRSFHQQDQELIRIETKMGFLCAAFIYSYRKT